MATKKTETKKTADKPVEAKATRFDSFRGVLVSKARGAVPRGSRFTVGSTHAVLTDSKGVELFRGDLADIAKHHLKSLGFVVN